ncbi:hypothetical protein ACH5RR_031877 [Cinchona calisaya]|uniref:Uncharacterized protein n=1 Tax=Cinchona calisaya TaxID=153742 RepID=A0ABD2YGI6_9GENT
MISARGNGSGDLGISRVFLNALALKFLPILFSDANGLVSCLLERLEIAVPNSPRELISSLAASSQSSPLSESHFQYQSNERASSGNEIKWENKMLLLAGRSKHVSEGVAGRGDKSPGRN